MPLRPGIERSRITASNGRSSIVSASSPVLASETSIPAKRSSRIARSPLRTISWSSTSKTRYMAHCGYGTIVTAMADGAHAASIEAELRRQLETAQSITHIGSWEWHVAARTVAWSDELYRIYGFEPQSVPVTLEFFLSRIHPDERER